MKILLWASTAVLLSLSAPMSAQAADLSDISVSTSIDYVTEYVFRGVSFSRGAVQPGIEASLGGFTVGVWSSAALGEASAAAGDEIDVYAGYSWSLSDITTADIGATIYHFPDVSGSLLNFGGASTLELYGGLAFDTTLSPSVYGFYDLDLEALTIEASLGHSISVGPQTSIDLGVTGGVVSVDGNGDYQYATASAAYALALSDNVSGYIGANYSLSSDDTLRFKIDGNGDAFTSDDNLFWAGVGVSAGF